MKAVVAGNPPMLGNPEPDAVQALVLALHAQLGSQREQIAALEAQLLHCHEHHTEHATLQAQVTALQEENLAFQTQVMVLQAEVQALRRQLGQNSTNSSRPPSSDPPQAAAKVKAKRKHPPSERKRGGQPGHHGSFRALAPIERVDQVMVVTPEGCGHCGQPFPESPPRRRARAWRHQVVEWERRTVQVTEYRREVRRCAQCGKRTRAGLPAGVPKGQFGPGLTALVAQFCGRYRMSRREVQQVLEHVWQVVVSLGAIVRMQQVQSAALEGPYTEARKAVQQAAVVNLDETGWRENKLRAWLWTVVTASLTVFLVDRHRSGAVVDLLLGEQFAGIVGSDRYSAYSRFTAKRRALCWAHLQRDFAALAEREGEAGAIGRWGLAEMQRMFSLWHRFRAGEMERAELLRRLVPLQARMGRLLRRGRESGDQKAAGLCRELTKWWGALWTFARVAGVEPTNNASERALRPGVLWRKGSFGSDTPAGSRFAERMMTVAATCKQQGRRLLDFLVAANAAALNGTAAPSLLPTPQGG